MATFSSASDCDDESYSKIQSIALIPDCWLGLSDFEYPVYKKSGISEYRTMYKTYCEQFLRAGLKFSGGPVCVRIPVYSRVRYKSKIDCKCEGRCQYIQIFEYPVYKKSGISDYQTMYKTYCELFSARGTEILWGSGMCANSGITESPV